MINFKRVHQYLKKYNIYIVILINEEKKLAVFLVKKIYIYIYTVYTVYYNLFAVPNFILNIKLLNIA